MNLPLSSLPSWPLAPTGRDLAVSTLPEAQRLVQPRQAETARAPRPVDPVNRLADNRLPTASDRPVGPPPAFAISLLQHLRETALDPPDRAPPAMPDAEEPRTASVVAQQVADAGAGTQVAKGRATPLPVLLTTPGIDAPGPWKPDALMVGAVENQASRASLDVRY
ncbi:MAG: hypothetical protein ACXIVG_12600 [Pararhodobacter sp.]